MGESGDLDLSDHAGRRIPKLGEITRVLGQGVHYLIDDIVHGRGRFKREFLGQIVETYLVDNRLGMLIQLYHDPAHYRQRGDIKLQLMDVVKGEPYRLNEVHLAYKFLVGDSGSPQMYVNLERELVHRFPDRREEILAVRQRGEAALAEFKANQRARPR